MNIKLVRLLPIALGIVLLSYLASSQVRESGAILGNVTDLEGTPLPGVTVTIESSNLIGGPQSMMTDAKGFYKFRALSIGEYKVTTKLTGFNTMVNKGLGLHAGMTLTCDFKMPPATIKEEVLVVGTLPTLDIKTSQPRPVIFTDNFLLSIPGKQSFEDVINLAPGVDYYSAYGSGSSAPNGWQIDGLNATSPFWGGSGGFIDYNVIKESSVQGLGLPAEYGHFTGAVLSVVSKSGSNKLSMLHELRYRGKGWNNDNRGSVPIDEWYDPSMATEKYEAPQYFDLGLQFGGKIIKDKLWFFISGRYNWTKEIFLGTTSPQITKLPLGFAKLTYQLNKSNKLNLSGQLYDQTMTGGGSPLYPPGVGNEYFSPDRFLNFSWTSIFSPTTFLDAKFGYHWFASKRLPIGGLEGAEPGGQDYGTGMTIGNISNYSMNEGVMYQGIAHLTHYIPEFIKGSHDLKLGIEFESDKIVTGGGSPGNETYIYYFGVPMQKTYREPYSNDSYNTMLTAFAEDRWALTKRLTFNIGARYDHYWYRYPQPERGIVYNNWNIAPRIGFTYDLLGDRKNVVKLHYGHYYEKSMRNWFGSFETRSQNWITYNYENGDWVEVARYNPRAITPIGQQEGLHHPYIRELTGGFERELFRDATLAINFYWRTIGKVFVITNTAAKYAPFTITIPGPDGIEGTPDDWGPLQVWSNLNPGETFYEFLNPRKGFPGWMTEDPKWYARGVQLIFTKRFSNRWQMIASYQYHRSKGNVSGVQFYIRDPNALVNAYGDSGWTAQPHMFKLQGNVLLPLDISLGVMASAMSGNSLDSYFFPFIPPSTWTMMWAQPVGSKKGRARYVIDLKVEKAFRVRGGRIEVFGDIYNLLNNYDDSGLSTYLGSGYMKLMGITTPRNFILGLRIAY